MKPKPLILFVDDFADTRDLYAHVLKQGGFRVALASDGQEALDQAFALVPDLIVLDLSLPVIGGAEVLTRLKTANRTMDIPVIVLTAHSAEDVAEPLREMGCAGLLIKPCLPDSILEEMTRVLKMQKTRRIASGGMDREGCEPTSTSLSPLPAEGGAGGQ